MMNKRETIKCNICKSENEKHVHYCINCGKNLSNLVELTDILWSINKFINFLLIIGVVLLVLMILTLNAFASMFGGNLNLDNNIYLIFICLFIGNYILRKYTIRKCKKNLDINKEVRNEKN